jgi:uncharacterized protein YndB with AHSA1/START domain
MSHCQQSRVLEANPAIVHAALTTTESLRGWWVQDCDFQTKAVGTFRIPETTRTCARTNGGYSARLPSDAAT